MLGQDTPQVSFRKSTYSDGGEGCVEVATLSVARLTEPTEDPLLSTSA